MTPDTLKTAFEASLRHLAPADVSRGLRDQAMAAFTDAGYPTRRHEDWRYTDLKPLLAADLSPAPETLTTEQIARARQLLESSALSGGAARLLFLDGRHVPDEDGGHPEGLAVLGHEAAWQRMGELGSASLHREHPLAALNTALTSSGTLIRLADGAAPTQPLHLVFVSTEGGSLALQPRILIDLGERSELTVVQHFLGSGTAPGWTNLVTQIVQGAESRLTLYRLQEYGAHQFHTELLKVRSARDARVELGYVDLGGRLVRNDVQVDLAEPGAACELFGVFLASAGSHVDNHIRIDHAASRTTSREAFRGIVGERGRGVFNGKVVVHRGAHGSDAQQSSDNLLLSEHGEIDTKPELEIYTDDVKCAHGATVGELDAQQLFYLRSRGVDERTARGLLTFAFANDVLRRIAIPEVRARVAASVAVQLPDYESWSGVL